MVVGNKRGNDETIFRIDNESTQIARLNKYLAKSLILAFFKIIGLPNWRSKQLEESSIFPR